MRFLIGWLIVVAGLITYEWINLPRPSGYLVEAVDPITGEAHTSRKKRLTWSDLESEITHDRRVLLQPAPTASERLFQGARDKGLERIVDEVFAEESQRWNEILNRLVPVNSIANPSDRNKLLVDVLSISEEVISANPELAMRLARLLELKKKMSLNPILAAQILDPGLDTLSKPAIPRLLWERVFLVTATPIAIFCLLEVTLLLMRRKAQSRSLESNSSAAENVQLQPVATLASSMTPSKESIKWTENLIAALSNRQSVWGTLIVAALLILLLGQLIQYSERHTARTTTKPTPSGNLSTNAEIRVLVSSQGTEGVAEAQWDQTFLGNLESYTRERITKLAKERLASFGQPNAAVVFESQAVYVESSNHKLAVIRIKGNDNSTHAIVHGIVDDQLKRVACIQTGPEQIPVSYGPCGEKIKEVFGVNLGAVKN